jgi:hypothetical protein
MANWHRLTVQLGDAMKEGTVFRGDLYKSEGTFDCSLTEVIE